MLFTDAFGINYDAVIKKNLMSDPKPIYDTGRYTLTVIVAVAALVVFSCIMMLWHGSYEKDANGKMHYNTRVNEPSTSY
jgi:hypothetical protein